MDWKGTFLSLNRALTAREFLLLPFVRVQPSTLYRGQTASLYTGILHTSPDLLPASSTSSKNQTQPLALSTAIDIPESIRSSCPAQDRIALSSRPLSTHAWAYLENGGLE
jgi:hypothetical protein